MSPVAPAARHSHRGFESETTGCLLCGSPRQSSFLGAPDVLSSTSSPRFTVVRCADCGLLFTNPRPSRASIGLFYPDTYAPHQRIGLTPSRRRRAGWWSRMPAPVRSRCPEHRGLPVAGRGRLLDIGCGGGAFLHRMHIQGWEVTGLDASSRVVERIRAELSLRALAGTLPHPKLVLERFDLVTMWMSLEHMHQPGQVLRECYRLLVPGGEVLVAVPNIESAAFRWFGTVWSGLDLPRHLTHFSPTTLRKMLEQAGFEVRSTRMLRRSQWLRDSAQLARRVGQKIRRSGLLQHKWPSRLAATCSAWTRQSDAMLMTAVKLTSESQKSAPSD